MIDKEDVKIVIQNASKLGHYVQISGKDRMLANGYEENLEKYFKLAKQDLYVSSDFDSLVNEDVYRIVNDAKKSVIMVTHDIAEAIAFCDKVLVLTSRPSSIKSIHNIKFDDVTKRTPLTVRKHALFKDYFDKIWGELDELKN